MSSMNETSQNWNGRVVSDSQLDLIQMVLAAATDMMEPLAVLKGEAPAMKQLWRKFRSSPDPDHRAIGTISLCLAELIEALDKVSIEFHQETNQKEKQ